jgi:hypothetical protein
MILTENNHFFLKQHYPVGFHSEEAVCFLWGTTWIVTYSVGEIQALKDYNIFS